MACVKPFFPGGVKFNVASVKNNHNNEKKSILNVALDAWCATSPAAQQHRTRQRKTSPIVLEGELLTVLNV